MISLQTLYMNVQSVDILMLLTRGKMFGMKWYGEKNIEYIIANHKEIKETEEEDE